MLRTAAAGLVASISIAVIATAGFARADSAVGGTDPATPPKPTTTTTTTIAPPVATAGPAPTAPVPTALPAPAPTAPIPTAAPAALPTPTVALPPFAISPLQWGPCEEGVDPEYECATLTVPLDYANPTAQSIGIAVIRLPADPSARVGAVLMNPGGPGGSGYDVVANAGSVIDTDLGFDGRFDVVGFDPRGVDRSGGLRCQDDSAIDATVYLDDTPDTPEEQAASDAVDSAYSQACRTRYGDTLRFYSTEYTARDMDAIRLALGDAQISYIGISYGTYLGGVYAALFPGQVRAMVLDSAYEPTGDSEYDQYVTQLAGFEEAFANWAAWCEEGGECLFSAVDVGARWDALIAALDANPIKSAGGRPVNQVVMEIATISSLYSRLSWPALGSALADAEAGDGTALLALADTYAGRDDNGTFDTQHQSGPVIRCASGIDQSPPLDPAALLAQLRVAAPRFSRGIDIDDFADNCLELLGQDVAPIVPAYAGPAPIVVIGGLNDPATPFRWAQELTSLMGPAASLVSFSGEGHGQILSSSCINDIEGAAITELVVPPSGTACDPDPDISRPAFWDQIPVPAGVGPLVEDPTIDLVLGLPATDFYSDVWFLTGNPTDVEAAYTAAFEALGFTVRSSFDPLPDTIGIPVIAPDGTTLIVLIIPPLALETNDDLSGAADLAPPGQGFVVVAALGEE